MNYGRAWTGKNRWSDYVEEPLGKLSERFENALNVSNTLIEKMKADDIDSIYKDLFSEDLRRKVSLEDFRGLINKIMTAKGKVVRYRKMQWGFTSTIEEGVNFIGSTKIVEHQKGMIKYLFVFHNDGKYDRIEGFHFNERKGVSPPGTFK